MRRATGQIIRGGTANRYCQLSALLLTVKVQRESTLYDAEHLTIELWTEESGAIKWTMHSNLNSVLNKKLVESMILEFAEGSMSIDDNDNRVLLNILCQKKGMTTTRWDPNYEFTSCHEYMWVKSNLYRAHWNVLGRTVHPGFLFLVWAIEWCYHKVMGHFKRSESKREARATPVPATPTNNAQNMSEALGGQSQAGGGTVIPFRRP